MCIRDRSDCDEITDNQSNNKITNNYENELTTDSSKIVENEIHKNNTVKIISDHNNIETMRERRECL